MTPSAVASALRRLKFRATPIRFASETTSFWRPTRRPNSSSPLPCIDESQLRQLAGARTLIGQKSFSWNRLLGDLERFVPKQARITGVRVTEIVDLGDGVSANIELKAAGKGYSEMNEMMSRIEESSGLFKIAGTAVQNTIDETGETPFTLNLIYSPARGGAQ